MHAAGAEVADKAAKLSGKIQRVSAVAKFLSVTFHVSVIPF